MIWQSLRLYGLVINGGDERLRAARCIDVLMRHGEHSRYAIVIIITTVLLTILLAYLPLDSNGGQVVLEYVDTIIQTQDGESQGRGGTDAGQVESGFI